MTAEGYVYELIFEGPADNSPDTLRRLKGVFIADLNLSVEEVQSILQATPTTIFRSDDKTEVQRCLGALKSAGAKVLLVAPKSDSVAVTPPATGSDAATDENSDGYVIEFDLNDSTPEPPKEPKTYSLDPLPNEDGLSDETEILDLDAPVLDQSVTAQLDDELSLSEEPAAEKKPEALPASSAANSKKAPSMLGSSPLIAPPDTTSDFGFSLDDDDKPAPASQAKMNPPTSKVSISPEAPVIPPEITAKQPTISAPPALDEAAGLDELLAIAEQNEEKQNLFEDLAIRELDEQKLVESAVKAPDDDFSLDLKPDAPSKVQTRPVNPPAPEVKKEVPLVEKIAPSVPPPEQTKPQSPRQLNSPDSVASASDTAVAAVNVTAVKAAAPISDQVAAEIVVPSELEHSAAPEKSDPASNRTVIIAAAVAVALFVLGNWFYLYVLRSSEVTNDDMLQVLPKSTIEKHAAKVDGAVNSEEGAKKLAVASGESKTVAINDSSSTRTIQAKFKLQAEKPVSVVLALTTTKPPELTPEQIVHNEPAPLWLERLETEELNFTQNEAGKLIARGAAKLYITQSGNNSRAVAQVEIEASFDAQKSNLAASISVFTTDPPADKKESLEISKDAAGTIKLLVSTKIEGMV